MSSRHSGFSRISGEWSDSPLNSTVWEFSSLYNKGKSQFLVSFGSDQLFSHLGSAAGQVSLKLPFSLSQVVCGCAKVDFSSNVDFGGEGQLLQVAVMLPAIETLRP